MQYTCHSGGAQGSDITWEAFGEEFGVVTVSYSFHGHRNRSRNNLILTQEDLDEGWEHAQIASEYLKRNLNRPRPGYVKSLISRNWFQVANAEEVFAIGYFDNKRKTTVKGGTGWAVQMAADNNLRTFLFDQDSNSWYMRPAGLKTFVEYYDVPTLPHDFAGIGTRKITEAGILAIAEVYEATFGELTTDIPTIMI